MKGKGEREMITFGSSVRQAFCQHMGERVTNEKGTSAQPVTQFSGVCRNYFPSGSVKLLRAGKGEITPLACGPQTGTGSVNTDSIGEGGSTRFSRGEDY